MLHIARTLPGELDGTFDPRDYGFDVIREEPPGPWECDERVAALYQQILDRTGMHMPKLDPVLARVALRQQALTELDTQPADALFARHDVQYPYECTFGKASLSIDEGVFCPTFTKASPLLLSAIDFRPGEHVLDAFSGSGAFGVNAALHGDQVVAFDKSERAVKCARGNATRNGVSDHVDVRYGTFGEIIPAGEKFDLVIANPPLLPGEPENDLGAAVFDPGLQATIDFIERLSVTLMPNGRCYLITSDVIERCGFDVNELCRSNKLKSSVVEQPDFGYEKYRVHNITLRQPKLGWLFASK